MRDDEAVAGKPGGGAAERVGGPVASRRPDKSGKRGRGGRAGREDARPAGGDGRSAGERVRRQVLFEAETACRFDVHCKGQMPQIDPVKELNRILLSYLRQYGRKREALDQDFGRVKVAHPGDGEDRQDFLAA